MNRMDIDAVIRLTSVVALGVGLGGVSPAWSSECDGLLDFATKRIRAAADIERKVDAGEIENCASKPLIVKEYETALARVRLCVADRESGYDGGDAKKADQIMEIVARGLEIYKSEHRACGNP